MRVTKYFFIEKFISKIIFELSSLPTTPPTPLIWSSVSLDFLLTKPRPHRIANQNYCIARTALKGFFYGIFIFVRVCRGEGRWRTLYGFSTTSHKSMVSQHNHSNLVLKLWPKTTYVWKFWILLFLFFFFPFCQQKRSQISSLQF